LAAAVLVDLLGVVEVGLEQRVQLSGEVALEQANDLLGGLAVVVRRWA
jgi:hypothetical protein